MENQDSFKKNVLIFKARAIVSVANTRVSSHEYPLVIPDLEQLSESDLMWLIAELHEIAYAPPTKR